MKHWVGKMSFDISWQTVAVDETSCWQNVGLVNCHSLTNCRCWRRNTPSSSNWVTLVVQTLEWFGQRITQQIFPGKQGNYCIYTNWTTKSFSKSVSSKAFICLKCFWHCIAESVLSDQTYASCMVVAAFSRNCNNGEIITKKSREKVGKIATFYYGLENGMSGKLSRESDGRECCSREKDVAPILWHF